MKVKELQELLNKCDPEEDVLFSMWEGCCGDSREITIGDVDVMDYASTQETKAGTKKIAPHLYFHPVPGYYSCIQTGQTLRNDREYWKDKKPSMLKKEEEK